jgi:chromosome segregation ATPase
VSYLVGKILLYLAVAMVAGLVVGRWWGKRSVRGLSSEDEARVADLETSRDTAVAQVATLEQQTVDAQVALLAIQEADASKETELASKEAELKNNARTVRDLEAQLEALARQVSDKRARIETLTRTVDEMTTARDTAVAAVHETDAELALAFRAQTRVSAHTAKLVALRVEHRRVREQLSSLRESLGSNAAKLAEMEQRLAFDADAPPLPQGE